MRKILPIIVLCLSQHFVVAAELPRGTSVLSETGQPGTTLTRFDNGDSTPTLVFKVKNESMPLVDQGQVLDELLEKTIKQQSLPDHFAVRLGGTRTILIKELQQKLMQPGANWDVAKGQPRRGAIGDVLSSELSLLLAQSPIGAAFAHHGYDLRVTGMERIEEEPKDFPQSGARVPTDILVIEITAERRHEQ